MNEEGRKAECFVVCLTNPMLYDKLHMFAAEYSIPVEQLANLAIKRLVDDVEFV